MSDLDPLTDFPNMYIPVAELCFLHLFLTLPLIEWSRTFLCLAMIVSAALHPLGLAPFPLHFSDVPWIYHIL